MSILNSIESALGGLMAQQKAMEVTGQNVANVNTPGYHRQEAVLVSRPTVQIGGSLLTEAGTGIGNGVDATTVRRYQNLFLQRQLLSSEGQTGRWTAMSDSLQQVEQVIAPGQDIDLSSMLDKFFGAWQTLSDNPEEMNNRLTVRTAAVNLTTALNSMASGLSSTQDQISGTLEMRVTTINSLADRMAELNTQIGVAKSEGRAPNDLQDERDQILEQLTTMAGVSNLSNDDTNGIINIGGRALVQGGTAFHVEWDSTGKQLAWETDGAKVNVQSGEIAGLYEVRDSIIPSYLQQLDNIASAMSSAVNNLHNNTLNPSGAVTMYGTPAGNFFTGTTAGGIAVASNILTDAGNIASTSTAGAPGDGSLAKQIFNLHQQPLVGSLTLNQSVESVIGLIGNATSTASTNLKASQALQTQVVNQLQSETGVSLDEEMTNLLIYQRAYDASARVLTIADQMLQTLIEKLG
ncbi:MAG TPA: flagellar hook-associated protein FlgK [Armatimonadota bacterium]